MNTSEPETIRIPSLTTVELPKFAIYVTAREFSDHGGSSGLLVVGRLGHDNAERRVRVGDLVAFLDVEVRVMGIVYGGNGHEITLLVSHRNTAATP